MAAASSSYEAVVGLEVHCRLRTASKAFCACELSFGEAPNTRTCPTCLGLPGALPVFNERALELALRLALALDCEVAERSLFARKSYFHPDLPKGYQISQFDRPLASGGSLPIRRSDGSVERVALTRIHLEEDAGKSLHEASESQTLLDFNRSGAPLVEIVTEPVLQRAEQAQAFLGELRRLVRWLGVGDGNMEQGSLRCDCNVSLRSAGSSELGTKVELKNLNSIRSVGRAIEHEIARQRARLEAGESVRAGTRHWDEAAGASRAMRDKETAPDYRYFPDPDLPALLAGAQLQRRVGDELGELPLAKELRLEGEAGLPREHAALVCSARSLAAFFEALAERTGDPEEAAKWVVGELLREVRERELELETAEPDWPVTVDQVAELMSLVSGGTVSVSAAKTVFAEMAGTGRSPASVVDELDLAQISDEGQLLDLVDRVLAANEQAVADHRAGGKSFGFLVGAAMKESGGRANPQLLRALLARRLEDS